MAIDFSTIKLTIMDLSVNASPDIFINGSGVSFSKRVLELMNYPANVQLGLDIDHKVFAVKVCRVTDAKSIPFVKTNSKPGNTLCITNKNLKDSLIALIPDANPALRYKLTGEYDREHRIMYFSLRDAVECEFQPPKK